MNRGALWATVHGVTKSGTRLSDFTHSLAHLFFHMWNWGFPHGSAVKNLPTMPETWVQSLSGEDPLEEEMATHSSVLAWEIPGTEESGGLQSLGLQRVRHDSSDLAQHSTAQHKRYILSRS